MWKQKKIEKWNLYKSLVRTMDNNTCIQLASNDEMLIYQSKDGVIKIDVLFENETVWLNIEQMSTLFGKSRSTINEHILHII